MLRNRDQQSAYIVWHGLIGSRGKLWRPAK